MFGKKSLNIQNIQKSNYSSEAQGLASSGAQGRAMGFEQDFEGDQSGVKAPEQPSHQGLQEKVILAAGCFWGVEARLRRIEGVLDTKVGYIGGEVKNPTYKQVCYENTEHAEACQVSFNTKKTSLDEILKVFWQIHNPTEVDRQGADVGSQYRSAIFFCNDAQREVAERSREQAQKQFARKIATEIIKAPQFWLAEEYHQRYFDKKTGVI